LVFGCGRRAKRFAYVERARIIVVCCRCKTFQMWPAKSPKAADCTQLNAICTRVANSTPHGKSSLSQASVSLSMGRRRLRWQKLLNATPNSWLLLEKHVSNESKNSLALCRASGPSVCLVFHLPFVHLPVQLSAGVSIL